MDGGKQGKEEVWERGRKREGGRQEEAIMTGKLPVSYKVKLYSL